jgi:hypothetical protein
VRASRTDEGGTFRPGDARGIETPTHRTVRSSKLAMPGVELPGPQAAQDLGLQLLLISWTGLAEEQ